MLPHKTKIHSIFRKKSINFLDKNPSIRKIVIRLYHTLFPENKLSYWIRKLDQYNPVNVVQIGSNDGITGDPLYDIAVKRRNWNLLLVEPIPYLFDKLRENYPKEKRFKFENVAINDGSVQAFYFIREGAFVNITTKWYKQIGSFDKSHLVKHFTFNVEEYIEEIEIKGVSLKQLLERNYIEKLDFLYIDAEGYDWKILSQLNLKKYKPHLILFEHKHLKSFEIKKSIEHLIDYKIYKFTSDYLCIHNEKLTRKDLRKLRHRAVN